MKLTNEEVKEQTRMHFEAIDELRKMPPTEVVMDNVAIFLVVMNLQLALTHPNNEEEGSSVIRDVARKLQTILGKQSRKAFNALEFGWECESDRQYNGAKCKACGAPIIWEQTKSGKWTPKDLDGGPHWATCPHAKQFKKGKTTNGKNKGANVADSSNR